MGLLSYQQRDSETGEPPLAAEAEGAIWLCVEITQEEIFNALLRPREVILSPR